MKIADLYRTVTNQIIAELEQGAAPWLKPWRTSRHSLGSLMPANFATGRPYHGINIPILWGACAELGYERHTWLTYKQAQDLGGQVRKGEKAVTVVFTKRLTVKEDEEERTLSMLRTYFVFNVAQVDGLETPAPPADVTPEARNDALDAFVGATGADVRHGGNIACYVPSKDFVNMPEFRQFETPESYYATILHELTHWTAAKARLDRDLSGRFGTRAYAAEELVAELGAAFLCAHLGITGELRHAGYIENWLRLLKEDDRAIFTAASKASRASDYLIGFSEPKEEELEEAA